MAYNCIIVEAHGKVGLVRLNRPKQFNALNDELMNELGDALAAFEADEKIGAIVITGSDKAFAAGADVSETKDNSFADAYNTNFVTRNWDCISGRTISAAEADRIGLVCRVVPVAELVEHAVATAATIANYSRPVVMMIKECVNRAAEMPLAEGLLFERRTMHSAFALRDQKEGMNAFLAKRAPTFTDE